MYRILVIDDQRIFKFPPRPEDQLVIHETTSQDGLRQLLKNGPWDEVYLDHDLGMESDQSGYDMISDALYLNDNGTPIDVGTFFVHTMNPVGGDRMVQAISRYFPVARINCVPFLDWDAMRESGRDPFYAGQRR